MEQICVSSMWTWGEVLRLPKASDASLPSARGHAGYRAYLDVFLQLGLMLPGELLMLPLKLGDEELPLDLLLLLQRQQLLL